jgi:hypothetical protein
MAGKEQASGGRKMKRDPMRETTAKWREYAESLKRQAAETPYGKERHDLMRKARQLDTASHLNEWVSSPALQPPT